MDPAHLNNTPKNIIPDNVARTSEFMTHHNFNRCLNLNPSFNPNLLCLFLGHYQHHYQSHLSPVVPFIFVAILYQSSQHILMTHHNFKRCLSLNPNLLCRLSGSLLTPLTVTPQPCCNPHDSCNTVPLISTYSHDPSQLQKVP